MTLIELLLIIINVGMLLWIMQLKTRVSSLEMDIDSLPPEQETLSPDDLKQIRASMNELVYEIEGFTEDQMRRITHQMSLLQTMISRIEKAEQERREKELEEMVMQQNAPRVVPLSPSQMGGTHKEKDRIIELHEKGWTVDKIASDLRITRSEVQLVVNLS